MSLEIRQRADGLWQVWEYYAGLLHHQPDVRRQAHPPRGHNASQWTWRQKQGSAYFLFSLLGSEGEEGKDDGDYEAIMCTSYKA